MSEVSQTTLSTISKDRYLDLLSIRKMNQMYRLPCPDFPTLDAVATNPKGLPEFLTNAGPTERITIHLENFKERLEDELAELDDVVAVVDEAVHPLDADALTAIGDWLYDLTIYCLSEAAKFGLDGVIFDLIMQSNFSKLGADGKPIIDENGTFKKGPNYWKPEERISNYIKLQHRLLQRGEQDNTSTE